MKSSYQHFSKVAFGVAWLCLALGAVFATAGDKQQAAQLEVSANDLVREAVNQELHPPAHPERFMYRMRKQTPEKVEIKEYVETDAGTIARLVAINDQPLSPEVQSNEDARLEQLIKNPELQKHRQRKQQEDEERVNQMVRALPEAFLYQYDGADAGKPGDLVRLKFEPNPKWVPASRELKIYQGMKGTMWIDPKAHRMVRLEATLFRDVDFGWGILGRLYAGGKFAVSESEIANGRWETTNMNLDFTGKELMFKSLRIKDQETLTDFHRVPDKLSLAEGIDLLRKVDPGTVLAQQHASQGTPQHGGGIADKR
jgi:hypothetical protein